MDTADSEALKHLGHLIHVLQDLHPGERSVAIEEAFAFYYKEIDYDKIGRASGQWTYILHLFDWERPAVYDKIEESYSSPFPEKIMDQLELEWAQKQGRK